MEIFSVGSLLRVIEPEERVCIDMPGYSSGVGRAGAFLSELTPDVLGACVCCVWRSEYNKIVIEAEVA